MSSWCVLVWIFTIPLSCEVSPSSASAHMGGWLVSPASANNHPYFHQWESKVPYKCVATPLFRLKLYCGGFLRSDFALWWKFFALLVRFGAIFYGTAAPCRDWWHTLQSACYCCPRIRTKIHFAKAQVLLLLARPVFQDHHGSHDTVSGIGMSRQFLIILVLYIMSSSHYHSTCRFRVVDNLVAALCLGLSWTQSAPIKVLPSDPCCKTYMQMAYHCTLITQLVS